MVKKLPPCLGRSPPGGIFGSAGARLGIPQDLRCARTRIERIAKEETGITRIPR